MPVWSGGVWAFMLQIEGFFSSTRSALRAPCNCGLLYLYLLLMWAGEENDGGTA